jgi:hypothetical protein
MKPLADVFTAKPARARATVKFADKPLLAKRRIPPDAVVPPGMTAKVNSETTRFRTTQNAFAMTIGGGLDIRINPRIACSADNRLERGARTVSPLSMFPAYPADSMTRTGSTISATLPGWYSGSEKLQSRSVDFKPEGGLMPPLRESSSPETHPTAPQKNLRC